MDPRKYQGKDLHGYDFPEGKTEADLSTAPHVLVQFSNGRIKDFQQACNEVLYGPGDNPQRQQAFEEYKTQGHNPRYLAQYGYARPFMTSVKTPKILFPYPYDNYIHPHDIDTSTQDMPLAA